MKRIEQNKSFLYTSLLYLCGFFLFLEWLYPVNQITDTSNLSIFIIFTFFCFFISIFQMKWWITFLLKGSALLFIIDGLFFDQTFMSALWIQGLSMEISNNLEALFSQQWYYLTPVFRSFLFLILIWLMSYLLHYWFVVMKRIFLFVILTFVYVGVLDTFTVYDAGMPIVRTFIISFIALGIANFMKELDKESIRFIWIKKTPIWLLPLVAIVLFSSLIGYAAPKFEPQWADPVPFLKSAANGGNYGGGSVVQKVGYGEDDSHLGGSFVQDYTPVFDAVVEEEHYWRIESKDIYTGKGWEVSADPDYEQQAAGSISLETFSPRVETEEQEDLIGFKGNTAIEKLVYPYGINEVDTLDAEFYLDNVTEAIQTRINNKVVSLDSYKIAYDHPSFEINELREASLDTDLPKQFTQVPESLPDRVGELAEEITASYDNNYDKAKAIEQYFGKNGFAYQTTDVPVPERNEDYVDQFLFDSKVGYCDNYSTSMVVMLRTLDIPTRWVKGFTSGELVEEYDAGSGSGDLYEITNANAHSWVEVYFPEVGWVPFEPTQGFSNLTDFHMDTENTAEEQQDDVQEQIPEQEEPTRPELPEEEEAASEVSPNEDITETFTLKWWHVLIGVVILGALLFTIYKTRFRWRTYLLAKKLQNRHDAGTFQEAYHHLLKVLDHYGFTKETDQTLREYAKEVDVRYGATEMGQMTNHYEQMLYRNKIKDSQVNELTQSWENLIKRIMA